MFESMLKAELSFPKLALRLIADRLHDRGITLTPSQRATLMGRLENLHSEDLSVTLELADTQVAGSMLTDEERDAGKSRSILRPMAWTLD